MGHSRGMEGSGMRGASEIAVPGHHGQSLRVTAASVCLAGASPGSLCVSLSRPYLLKSLPSGGGIGAQWRIPTTRS